MTKLIGLRKGNSAESMDIRRKIIYLDSYFKPYKNNSYRLIVDINVKIKTISLSSGNTGSCVYKFEVNQYFLNRSQKVLTTKKLDKVIYIEI